ncbi:MAG: DUF2490 domain-containing protein [Cyclobacteriaceae bacterium]|nr:DUF2490 domain-containing protein [Cyclobacteriaceae bacterium]
MKIFGLNFFTLLVVVFLISSFDGLAQEELNYEKQLWAGAYFNWKLDDKWVYNQDFGYQHLYETPTFTRISLRSQINRQLAGSFSLHGGMNFFYKINEFDNNAIEIRPWVGAKLRWPYFWRFNFVHYLRFEQRFEHTFNVNDWENNFRGRYKIASNIPINHGALIDKTLYGVIAYEFFTVSFGDDVRFTKAATHRFDLGMGYRQNTKVRYEAIIIAFNTLDEDTEHYSFSNFVLFLKYKRYIHWERSGNDPEGSW